MRFLEKVELWLQDKWEDLWWLIDGYEMDRIFSFATVWLLLLAFCILFWVMVIRAVIA